MKKFTLFAFLFWSAFLGYGQLIISSGSHLVISNSSEVVANDVTNLGGNITNDGTLTVKGDLTNTTTSLLSSGSTGTVTFAGSSAQKITGDTDAGFYGTLKIDNSTGVSIAASGPYSGSDQTVNGQLTFTDGSLSLNEFDLTLGTTDPTGVTSSKYIKTNGTGGLKRNVANNATNVTYHVGNSTYNPLVLQNSATATADTYKVVVVDHEPKNSVASHMVDRSWEVTESAANGSKLTVTPQWSAGNELPSFDRSNNAVGLTADAGSTYNWRTYGATSGTYTRAGSTFTGVGTFAVADKDYVSDNTTVTDVDIANSNSDCFNAVNTLTVAEEETVTVESGGEATFVAGQNIIFKPGFHSQSGSTAHAYITESGDYCNSRFVVEFQDKQISTEILLLNLQGSIVEKTTCEGIFSKELNIGHLPQGMYIVLIKTETKRITKKIIKNY